MCGCALTPETSYGFEAIDFAANVLKRPYDPWQEFAVIHAGELFHDGRPRFNFVLIIVARQNGKTEIPVLLVPYWMLSDEDNITLGTSTTLEYAEESWEKVVRLMENEEYLAQEIPSNGIRRGSGKQELITRDRSRYKIAAANRKAGRSLTIRHVILDELREHFDWSAHDAAVNATNAVPDAQVWALSNQGDERGVVLDALRESALLYIQTKGEQGDQRLGLFEWSSPNGSAPDDPVALAYANPNLNRRIMLDNIIGRARRAKANGGLELAGWKTEAMCMRVRELDPAIPEEHWLACSDPGDLSAYRRMTVACLDVSPDGEHATLVAAAKMDDGRVRVDVVKAWSGPNCLKELRRDLADEVRRVKPRVLGWIPNGPAAAVAAEFVDAPHKPGSKVRHRKPFGPGVIVEEITGEVTAICMGLAAMVKDRDVAHSDDPLLLAHIGGAERLWQGDAWRFMRRGAGHCDGAYATAGSVHLARVLPPPPPAPKLVVSQRGRPPRD